MAQAEIMNAMKDAHARGVPWLSAPEIRELFEKNCRPHMQNIYAQLRKLWAYEFINMRLNGSNNKEFQLKKRYWE